VPIHVKNLIPVGIAMSIVMSAKNGSATWPVTYMWWAHTETDSPEMAIVAKTRLRYPNTGLPENTGMTSVMTPKKGSAMMYTSGWPKNQNRCCHRIGP